MECAVVRGSSEAEPRIALVSVGLGRIQRGYERYFSGLFDAVRNRCNITLYKSAGESREGEKVPALLRPFMTAARALPLGLAAGTPEHRTYRHDCYAFGLSLLPQLLRGKTDVIHVIDYPLAVALTHLRRRLHFRTRVIFADGGLMPPQYYPRANHIHHVAEAQFQKAIALGIPRSHQTMVPCGLYTGRFAHGGDRLQLREKYGVSQDAFVILAVTALNRGHKRVDFLIGEVSRVQGDVLFWLDGIPEDPTLIALAREKLGARCRVTHVPTEDVPELYRLADVFVHGALEEGFGLAICEAASSDLMVLVHDSPHFRWLVGDRNCTVDMTVPGALARRLGELAASPDVCRETAGTAAKWVRSRFDWDVLAPEYVDMYRRVSAQSANGNGT